MGVPGAAQTLAPGAGQPRAAQALAPRAGSRPEPYLHNTLLGEFALSATKEVLPEDAWLPTRLRPGGDYAPEGRAYSSERRTVISATAVMVS
jgi:hypothetical protein